VQGVASSNPATPTNQDIRQFSKEGWRIFFGRSIDADALIAIDKRALCADSMRANRCFVLKNQTNS
jgi:hypothetical protein